MRVFETLFHLTILLTFVFGTSIRRSSESFRENVETEQAAQSNANVQPRGGRKSLRIFFKYLKFLNFECSITFNCSKFFSQNQNNFCI